MDQVVGRLEEGKNVAVHCMGGLGRSGTLAASVLVSRRMDAERAIREVRAARPGAIENATQEGWVHRFAVADR